MPALLALLTALTLAAPAADWVPHARAGLSFHAPPAAEVTEHDVGPDVKVVAVTLAEEVLLLTVYGGAKPPPAARALATHLEELERRLGKDGPFETKKVRLKALGGLRDGHRVSHRRARQEHLSWVLAHREGRKGPTVVASWSVPAVDADAAFAPKLLTALKL